MIINRAQELSTSTLFNHSISPLLNPPATHLTTTLTLPLHTSFFSSSLSLSHHHHFTNRRCHCCLLWPLITPTKSHQSFRRLNCVSTSVEQLAYEEEYGESEVEGFRFDDDMLFSGAGGDLKHLEAPEVAVKELDEMPEQWRRSRLAWLCKELPSYKAGTLVKILNDQRKWMRQEDATYVVIHCTRIRENDAAFKVYKWMVQQSWYRFDFALATKLADYLGKERKYAKCREVFDDIINQGRVPSESTFHILIVAYLSAPVQDCVEEACSIYNRMIQLGGYQPRVSLHNSLFRALVSKPGGASKHHLKQAEFIYHNLEASGLEIQKDIYGGLIWLHSYQETIDKERVTSLRKEMKQAGIEEGTEVHLSILRVCSKAGDVEEAERTWIKLLHLDDRLPSQAFVYRMEVFAKVGEPMKSLEIFRKMEEMLGSPTVAAYHKIIEVLCKTKEMEHAETLMEDFINSGMKPLTPSFIDLMNMYFNLGMHEKLESIFSTFLEKCRPSRTVYNIYLDSLLEVGNLNRAEEIFKYMSRNEIIGVNAKSYNTILRVYLSSGNYAKAEKIYYEMCQKKYDIESSLMENLEFALRSRKKEVKKPVSLSLTKEQREILVGLALGGLKIESGQGRKKHVICFEFNDNFGSSHSVLRRHLHDQYHEWLHPSCKTNSENIPYRFFTVPHSCFGFYADQFCPNGRPKIPNLIHRWLSLRALAYWYMYGGYKTSSGDILLKAKGGIEGVGKIVKIFKAKSLDCRVKKKGRVFWIGFLGSNSIQFWNLIEPFVLDGLKDILRTDDQSSENNTAEAEDINFGSESDFEEDADDYNDMNAS